MKIAILTQPLQDNYGGLLQAYALKETLIKFGHEVVIINRRFSKKTTLKTKAKSAILKFKTLIAQKSGSRAYKLTKKQQQIISTQTNYFRSKYIPELSEEISEDKQMSELNYMQFDAYIVGSDQCWRPKWSPNIYNYFLDFTKKEKNIKRISYAASFGTSEWEFSDKETKTCKSLLNRFDNVSVRERSAIELVKDKLGRDDAVFVLDPTMLLKKEDYLSLISPNLNNNNKLGTLNAYILDKTAENSKLIEYVENKLDLKSFEVMPNSRLKDKQIDSTNILEFQFPSPELWLKGFKDAEFVVTDSFHGTVFSILFNKPFITIGNNARGMARFHSILETFNLSDRLTIDTDPANIENILKQEIDWKLVNRKLAAEKIKSLNYLITSLE